MTEKKYKLKATQTELNRCYLNCECKKCERCSNCDYTVNGLRTFYWRGDKLFCEFCLQDQQKEKKLTTLTGITTSQINQALKADNPYPARVFLKVDCSTCFLETKKCDTEKDIPVFFRIKETPTYEGFIKSRAGKYINYFHCHNTSVESKCTYEYAEKCGECSDKFKSEFKNCGSWIRPKIKTGSIIEVQGNFTNSINGSNRKSFTATSYRLISCPHSQKKPYHCPVDCLCEKGQQIKILDQAKTQFPYLKTQAHLISRKVEELFTKQKEIEKVKNHG